MSSRARVRTFLSRKSNQEQYGLFVLLIESGDVAQGLGNQMRRLVPLTLGHLPSDFGGNLGCAHRRPLPTPRRSPHACSLPPRTLYPMSKASLPASPLRLADQLCDAKAMHRGLGSAQVTSLQFQPRMRPDFACGRPPGSKVLNL